MSQTERIARLVRRVAHSPAFVEGTHRSVASLEVRLDSLEGELRHLNAALREFKSNQAAAEGAHVESMTFVTRALQRLDERLARVEQAVVSNRPS